MLDVDRRGFIPKESAGETYLDEPVVLKVGPDGRPASTTSQPTMVALMLEQLAPRPGDRVLEVGTASGYNAALLARLVGDQGVVVTVEIDGELAALAADRLRDLANVEVVVGDGRRGFEAQAPYQGIVVTAGASEVAPAWIEQIALGGRLVVPITRSDRHGRCITYEKAGDGLVELASTPCGFVPLRSADD